MTDHFRNIYVNKADLYDRMVSREDYQGNLLKALQSIHALDDTDVVEFGAGTGRVTRLLVPHVKLIRSFDAEQTMLDVAEQSLKKTGFNNWTLSVGDNGNLPVEDNSADVTLEGWSFGHAQGWHADRWQEVIDQYVGEMYRITKPSGTAILIETQGTGSEQPAPPTEGLAKLYQYIEDKHDFQFQWIRTDYKFESVAEADELTRFFFGDELADRIVKEQLTILPECTGIWWKTV